MEQLLALLALVEQLAVTIEFVAPVFVTQLGLVAPLGWIAVEFVATLRGRTVLIRYDLQ